MRRYYLLAIIALLGCGSQEREPLHVTDPSTAHTEEPVPIAPTPLEMEISQSIPSGMDRLRGKLKSDSAVLVSIDASSTVDDMLKAIEKKNQRRLAEYERMGWMMSVTSGTRFLALHSDEYPYIRIKLDGGNFRGRIGYIHKKYLDLDEKNLNLRYFTSDRGKGTVWRSR